MTDTDRIAQMAREAGFSEAWVSAGANPPNHPAPIDMLQAFARLVAEDCAHLCAEQGEEWDSDAVVTEKNYAKHCAQAIRARYSKEG